MVIMQSMSLSLSETVYQDARRGFIDLCFATGRRRQRNQGFQETIKHVFPRDLVPVSRLGSVCGAGGINRGHSEMTNVVRFQFRNVLIKVYLNI